MSKRNRRLSGFDSAATDPLTDTVQTDDNENVNHVINNIVNDDVKIDVNDNNSNEVKETLTLDELFEGSKSKVQTHTLKGFYLEMEVAAAIDRISKGKSRGFKSQLVNEILKKELKMRGLLGD